MEGIQINGSQGKVSIYEIGNIFTICNLLETLRHSSSRRQGTLKVGEGCLIESDKGTCHATWGNPKSSLGYLRGTISMLHPTKPLHPLQPFLESLSTRRFRAFFAPRELNAPFHYPGIWGNFKWFSTMRQEAWEVPRVHYPRCQEAHATVNILAEMAGRDSFLIRHLENATADN